MDGTPLDRAYTFAKAADAAVLAGDFTKAAQQFAEAADHFEQVYKANPGTASARTLQALAEQHKGLAEYFSSGRAALDVKKHVLSPSSSTYHNSASPQVNGGANANGFPLSQGKPPPVNSVYYSSKSGHSSGQNDTNGNPASRVTSSFASIGSPTVPIAPNSSSTPASLSVDEAISSLASRSAAVFARTFDNVVASKLGASSASTKSSSMPSGNSQELNSNAPSESFYLVKPKAQKPSFAKQSLNALAQARAPGSNKVVTSDFGNEKSGSPSAVGSKGGSMNGATSNGVGLSNVDRAQALERATNAQREALKSGLQQIFNLILQKEEQLRDEQLGEIDQLRAENDRLKIQVSKLKSRWEDLKESARKRQTPADS